MLVVVVGNGDGGGGGVCSWRANWLKRSYACVGASSCSSEPVGESSEDNVISNQPGRRPARLALLRVAVVRVPTRATGRRAAPALPAWPSALNL